MRLRPRFTGIVAAPKAAAWETYEITPKGTTFEIAGDYAVVDVKGPLVQARDPEYDSYEEIAERALVAFQSLQPAVCLRINSPGGDFPGCLEFGRQLRGMADKYGKKLIVFTAGECFSAAYALACAADEIVVTPSAFVGSIGVWTALVDLTMQNAMLGQNVIIVSSGERKVDRNPNVAINQSTIDATKSQVDEMASLFFSEVSRHRGLPVDGIKAIDGGVRFGSGAVATRLADRIVDSWAEFVGQKVCVMDEYMEALAKAADKGDKKAKAALTALASYKDDGDGDSDKDKKDKEDDGGSRAAAYVPPVAAPLPASPAPASGHSFAATGAPPAGPSTFELAAQLHALQVSISAERAEKEKAELLATRGDFSKEVRASLQAADISFVRTAVTTWPKASNVESKAKAQVPAATRGSHSATAVSVDDDSDSSFVMKHMNFHAPTTGVREMQNGKALELGVMTPEQAREAYAKLTAKGAGSV